MSRLIRIFAMNINEMCPSGSDVMVSSRQCCSRCFHQIPRPGFPTADEVNKRCRSVCHCRASVFFHRSKKNNDAALERCGRHSATHWLNEERRRGEPSSFISSRRDNKTERKKKKICRLCPIISPGPPSRPSSQRLLKRSAAAL